MKLFVYFLQFITFMYMSLTNRSCLASLDNHLPSGGYWLRPWKQFELKLQVCGDWRQVVA